MSLVKEAIAPCSKCGEQQKIKIYKSINVSEDPELKELVKNGSLFIWECPHCGQRNLAKYDTLYHDREGRLMVWMFPDGQVSEAQMQSVCYHAKAMGGYTLRLVGNMGELMEKVLIHEAHLDDVIIEMCKYVIKYEMLQKIEDEYDRQAFMATPFHFYRLVEEEGSKYITLMYARDGAMAGVNIGWNVYEDCQGIVSRNPSLSPGEGFARIDADWLLSMMK